MQKFIRFLSSTKLATVLLIIITVVSTAGITFQNSQDFWQKYSLGRFLLSPYVKIHDAFHAWWFIILLLLLALNLGFCTWKRVRVCKQTGLGNANISITGGKTVFTRQSAKMAAENLEKLLTGKGFKFYAEENGGLAIKNRFTRWGSICFHVSMVIILLGGAVNQLWGYKGQTLLQQAITTDLSTEYVFTEKGYLAKPPTPTLGARLDNFRILLAEPKKYAQLYSTVTFFKGRTASQQEISVNSPGNFAGLSWRFKEFGYSPDIKIVARQQELLDTFFNISTREPYGQPVYKDKFRLADTLEAEMEFIPDAFQGNPAATQSYAPKNPYVHVLLKDKDSKVFDRYIPLNKTTAENGMKVTFKGYRHWVLLDITANPGEYIMFFGFGLCILGLTYRFLFIGQWIRYRVEPVAGGSQITYRARADYFNKLFKEEIDILFTDGVRETGCPETTNSK